MLDDLVSLYSGTAQQIADALNADDVQWRPVSLKDLNALCDKLGITLWLNQTYATTGDAAVKLNCAKALALFTARYDNLDLQDPEVRDLVAETFAVLSAVPGSPLTPAVVDRIYGLGRTVVNRGRDANGGEPLTVEQVQAALDRNARRLDLADWYNAALARVAAETPVPTLDQLLAR